MASWEQRPGGVCAAVVTPLDAALAPDAEMLIAHCRRLLAHGCDAINLLGTTGEATSLSVAARLEVMHAVGTAGLPLSRFLVGTGAAALADAIVLTRTAVELGFGGQLVIPPFYFKGLIDDGVFAFYERLIEALSDNRLRLYLYNFPQLSGFTFSAALVARLSMTFAGTVAGLKDSSGVAGYAAAIVRACPNIDIFPSSETALSDARAAGFAGCISATLNVTAPLAAPVWRGSQSEVPALSAMRSAMAAHQLVPAVRAVLAELSGDERWRRPMPPLVALPEHDAAALIAELEALPEFGTLRRAYACA